MPMTGPNPSRRNPSAKASPSEAVFWSTSTTMWPLKAYCMFQVGLPGPVFPVHPGLPHELLEDDAIDVPAAISTDVDDEPLPVEDGIEVPIELVDVAPAHGPQVEVSDLALALFLHLSPSGCTPNRCSGGSTRPKVGVTMTSRGVTARRRSGP